VSDTCSLCGGNGYVHLAPGSYDDAEAECPECKNAIIARLEAILRGLDSTCMCNDACENGDCDYCMSRSDAHAYFKKVSGEYLIKRVMLDRIERLEGEKEAYLTAMQHAQDLNGDLLHMSAKLRVEHVDAQRRARVAAAALRVERDELKAALVDIRDNNFLQPDGTTKSPYEMARDALGAGGEP
jgi:hypothetical protein